MRVAAIEPAIVMVVRLGVVEDKESQTPIRGPFRGHVISKMLYDMTEKKAYLWSKRRRRRHLLNLFLHSSLYGVYTGSALICADFL